MDRQGAAVVVGAFLERQAGSWISSVSSHFALGSVLSWGKSSIYQVEEMLLPRSKQSGVSELLPSAPDGLARLPAWLPAARSKDDILIIIMHTASFLDCLTYAAAPAGAGGAGCRSECGNELSPRLGEIRAQTFRNCRRTRDPRARPLSSPAAAEATDSAKIF